MCNVRVRDCVCVCVCQCVEGEAVIPMKETHGRGMEKEESDNGRNSTYLNTLLRDLIAKRKVGVNV